MLPQPVPPQIKNAYKKQSLRFHPDVVPAHARPAAEARFKQLSAAYSTALSATKAGAVKGWWLLGWSTARL